MFLGIPLSTSKILHQSPPCQCFSGRQGCISFDLKKCPSHLGYSIPMKHGTPLRSFLMIHPFIATTITLNNCKLLYCGKSILLIISLQQLPSYHQPHFLLISFQFKVKAHYSWWKYNHGCNVACQRVLHAHMTSQLIIIFFLASTS